MNCSKCGSEKLLIERRPNGIIECLDCGYKEVNGSQKSRIVLTKHEVRQYKKCMCAVCSKISKCTPTSDFYSTPDHGDGILCEKCFYEYFGHKQKNQTNGPH
jgi:ribosomal protein L37AE/L43A